MLCSRRRNSQNSTRDSFAERIDHYLLVFYIHNNRPKKRMSRKAYFPYSRPNVFRRLRTDMKTLVMQGRTGDRKTGRIGDGRGMGGGREVGWKEEVKEKRAGAGNARYGRREFRTPLIPLPPLSCDIDLREVLWAHETEQVSQTLVFTKTAEHKPSRRSMLLCHNLLRCWKICMTAVVFRTNLSKPRLA